mmetsp:Transcript_12174/g.36129  ORF Transcript_12174/g.36129 Transcript_12174/m.36129 type:complete len:344 (+) Transcript_12174:1006-2037(+)
MLPSLLLKAAFHCCASGVCGATVQLLRREVRAEGQEQGVRVGLPRQPTLLRQVEGPLHGRLRHGNDVPHHTDAGHVPLVGSDPEVQEALRLDPAVRRDENVQQRGHLAHPERHCQIWRARQAPAEAGVDLMQGPPRGAVPLGFAHALVELVEDDALPAEHLDDHGAVADRPRLLPNAGRMGAQLRVTLCRMREKADTSDPVEVLLVSIRQEEGRRDDDHVGLGDAGAREAAEAAHVLDGKDPQAAVAIAQEFLELGDPLVKEVQGGDDQGRASGQGVGGAARDACASARRPAAIASGGAHAPPLRRGVVRGVIGNTIFRPGTRTGAIQQGDHNCGLAIAHRMR